MSYGETYGFFERKCPICGKDFIFYVSDNYVYKSTRGGKKQMFCSWTCMNKFFIQQDELLKQKRKRRRARKHNDE